MLPLRYHSAIVICSCCSAKRLVAVDWCSLTSSFVICVFCFADWEEIPWEIVMNPTLRMVSRDDTLPWKTEQRAIQDQKPQQGITYILMKCMTPRNSPMIRSCEGRSSPAIVCTYYHRLVSRSINKDSRIHFQLWESSLTGQRYWSVNQRLFLYYQYHH